MPGLNDLPQSSRLGNVIYHRALLALKRLALMLWIVSLPVGVARAGDAHSETDWVGTWAAASQPPMPGTLDHYSAQSLRLIVHVSAGGPQVRIRLSNRYGNTPLMISDAHIARRTSGADIDPASDRALTFNGRTSVVIPAHAMMLSDPASLAVPALSDLAVSLYFPKAAAATTVHILAQQTSYVSRPGDNTAAAHFPIARHIDSWPFLAGVEVAATPPAFSVVAFGDSMVDGDGSTADANRRWPDALAVRLRQAGQNVAMLNAGLIGNRLLHDSPSGSSFGTALGESGLARFQHDALDQAGAKVVIVRIGGNDLGFLHALAPASETLDANDLIAGYRRLIALAHQHGLSIIGTTISPFENADLPGYYTPAKDVMRQHVNAWIRHSGEFDAVLDFDQILRDPSHPARLLPAYDSGDHLHPNDAGYSAIAAALPLATIDKLASRTTPSSAVEANDRRRSE
ncbi:MAG: SGNH/GDSL hydrolase family protein [Rhodanobacter sp.]